VRPDGMLLFYFAGHGMIDSAHRHPAPRGDRHRPQLGALDGRAVRVGAALVPGRPGRRPRGDLDCCYSGRATDGMGEPAALADQIEIDRTCVLVAAPANRTALAPPDEPFTAFTGVLLDMMRHGVPGGPALLDLTTLYRQAGDDRSAPATGRCRRCAPATAASRSVGAQRRPTSAPPTTTRSR
jgi:hypothetical protein